MHLIVGIDPGTTTGVAVLNFNGKLIDLSSSKDMGIDEVIKYITRFGIASVIACDVSPAPQFVNKLSAKTGAVVFKPHISLSIKEKNESTKNFMVKDSHQRDSLASALNAFNNFKNKFMKIDAMDFDAVTPGDKKEEIKDEIKHKVIHGHSIDSAVTDLMEEKIEKVELEEEIEKAEQELPAEIKRIHSTFSQRLAECNSTIKELEHQNKILREEIKAREKEIEELNDKILEVKRKYTLELHRDKKISEDEQIIQSFEYGMKDLQARLNEKINDIDKLVELWCMAAKQQIIPVGVFPEKFNGISWMRRKFKKKDYSNLHKIKVLFISNIEEHKDLFEKRIILCDEKYIKEFSGCAYILADELETAKREAEELKNKLIKVDEEKLMDMIESYRSEKI